jgi:CheY-like chemotaxis protein
MISSGGNDSIQPPTTFTYQNRRPKMNEQSRFTPPRHHILCVDDDKNILKTLKRLLMLESFGVLTATSGMEGLAILRSDAHIDLIVSDQRMPGMSGSDFLAAARELAPHIPRMMLTGYSDASSTADALIRGEASCVLTKPWKTPELLREVRAALEPFVTDSHQTEAGV